MEDLKRPDIVVIGCGNANRCDDGAGPAVIARLRDRGVPDGVRLYDAGTDGMSVIYQARGASHLVIIDARKPSGNPGAVYEVPGDVLAAAPNPKQGLHDFRWDHALYAGQKIYKDAFPGVVAVFLIEAASLDLGLQTGPEVTRAVQIVADQIGARAKEWLAA
ncbi:MAG: hydrogenase maturation protease [Phreatobacter sp.]|nr:hydrogenase maturation protease [Phreatobacter sp.]